MFLFLFSFLLSLSAWSKDGCKVGETSSKLQTVCECTHFSTFALIVKVKEKVMDDMIWYFIFSVEGWGEGWRGRGLRWPSEHPLPVHFSPGSRYFLIAPASLCFSNILRNDAIFFLLLPMPVTLGILLLALSSPARFSPFLFPPPVDFPSSLLLGSRPLSPFTIHQVNKLEIALNHSATLPS